MTSIITFYLYINRVYAPIVVTMVHATYGEPEGVYPEVVKLAFLHEAPPSVRMLASQPKDLATPPASHFIILSLNTDAINSI